MENITIKEAMEQRHSVRRYLDKVIDEKLVAILQNKINELNIEGKLHIQLVLDEPKAFHGINSYGAFHGVKNYIVMIGKKSKDLDRKVGYYGEQIVLLAQMLGLNTCWVGLTYSKIKGICQLEKDEKIACVIAIGYGVTQGLPHKIKTIEQVSNISASTPCWFRSGVEAALLAPTAMHQQKFYFEYIAVADGKDLVRAKSGFSLFGYTQMDLGIAQYHFEIGAGHDNFMWE